MKTYLGNNKEVLKTFESNSIDSIVTDPPYELGFMGKSWDSSGIAYDVELWCELLRVLKPGGHLLAFSGTRTYHRMAVAIEDAGFEIRDMIEWVYGSGFPKSLNIGKAVDKIAGETGRKEKFTEWMRTTGITICEINKLTNSFMGSHYLTAKEQPAIPTSAIWGILRPHIKIEIPKWVDELVERIEREREVVGKDKNWGEKSEVATFTGGQEWDITKGTSEFEGWGTALKPAHEPICMARKPLEQKTVAENCLKWGTGGINIDESRVGFESEQDKKDACSERPNAKNHKYDRNVSFGFEDNKRLEVRGNPQGRFPANIITDGSEEVMACFPKTKSGSGIKNPKNGAVSSFRASVQNDGYYSEGDSGNASRFFKSIIYTSKPSKAERNKGCEPVFNLFEQSEGLEEKQTKGGGGMGKNNKELEEVAKAYGSIKAPAKNFHPTVKPIELMEYLIKMVTPKGGIVLDPFMGSGSTGCGAIKNGFDFIGIDLTPEYLEIAEKRIKRYMPI